MKDKILYFDIPTQVAFWEAEQKRYLAGIAYGTEIICGCCGGIIEITEVYEFAPKDVKPIIIYDNWEPFDDFIIADNERYFEREEDDEDESM